MILISASSWNICHSRKINSSLRVNFLLISIDLNVYASTNFQLTCDNLESETFQNISLIFFSSLSKYLKSIRGTSIFCDSKHLLKCFWLLFFFSKNHDNQESLFTRVRKFLIFQILWMKNFEIIVKKFNSIEKAFNLKRFLNAKL